MNYDLNKEQVLSLEEMKALQRAAKALGEASTITKIPIDYLKDFVGMMALNHVNRIREIPEPQPRNQNGKQSNP